MRPNLPKCCVPDCKYHVWNHVKTGEPLSTMCYWHHHGLPLPR